MKGRGGVRVGFAEQNRRNVNQRRGGGEGGSSGARASERLQIEQNALENQGIDFATYCNASRRIVHLSARQWRRLQLHRRWKTLSSSALFVNAYGGQSYVKLKIGCKNCESSRGDSSVVRLVTFQFFQALPQCSHTSRSNDSPWPMLCCSYCAVNF
jgi:hypothetical protein